jgi:Skp family chaperone for outer membrane proteins
MKISKKLMGLVAALCVASAAVNAGLNLVTVDGERLLHESEQGKALKSQLEKEARALQEQQQAFVADLQKAGKEFQTKAKLMSKTAQEQELARLQKMEKKAQRTLQENAAEFQESAKMQQELLHAHNMAVAAAMLEEKGWNAIAERRSLIAVSADHDVTDEVLAALNAEYKQSSDAILMAANDAAPADEVVTA